MAQLTNEYFRTTQNPVEGLDIDPLIESIGAAASARQYRRLGEMCAFRAPPSR